MAMGPGFKIVEGPMDAKWFNVGAAGGAANTVMIGQIVKYNAASFGVAPLAAAVDAPQVSANGIPFGIVIGVNNRTPLSNSTYSTQYGTQVITQATELARDYFGAEGMHSKGDPALKALVALIIPNVSVIEGPICQAAYGTQPTIVTCTTVDTNGISGMVHGSGGMTATAAGTNLYCCRTGKNKGLYRSSNAASITTPEFFVPWPYSWVVGDTFSMVNLGMGRQKLQTDALSMYIDNAANTTSGNHFLVDVLSMDLAQAGLETVQFRFVHGLS